MDGSRSLRKRKSEDGEPSNSRQTRKRRRQSATSVSSHASRSVIRVSVPRQVEEEAIASDDGGSPKRTPRSRRARPQREKKSLTRLVPSKGISLILAFSLDRPRVQDILSKRPKKKRIRDRRKTQLQHTEPEVSHYPAIQSNLSNLFFAFNDRETDETKSKPYGGILNEIEADTARTFPQASDRKRFEDARLMAEDEWKQKTINMYGPPEQVRPSQKASGPPSKIKCINFGGWEIDTWHAAPYPEEYSRNRVLYICEFCLKYMNSDFVAWRHKVRSEVRSSAVGAKFLSSNALINILLEMKYTEMAASLSLRWMEERTRCTARIFAYWRSCFSVPKLSTTMSSHSYFIL